MNFALSEEQAMLRDSVRRYVGNEYGFEARRALLARDGGFSRAQWKTFADMGWLGIGLDEACGGYGGGLIENALVAEEFGRGLVVEPYGDAVLAARLLQAATDADAAAHLAALIAGDTVYAVAHAEAAARGREGWVETRARSGGPGYVLSGAKASVAAAPGADVFVVSARLDGAPDAEAGLGLFAVPATAPGLTLRAVRRIDGALAADLLLDDVALARSALLLDGRDAGVALERALAAATLCGCAAMVGAMEQALWITRDYLRTRKQFGVAIGSFQALQHRMADMYIALEQARAHLHRGMAFAEHDDAAIRRDAVSAAKALIGRSARYVAAQAVQLHGGIGVTDECSIGHYFKHLTVLEASYGNSDFHLARIAAALRAA